MKLWFVCALLFCAIFLGFAIDSGFSGEDCNKEQPTTCGWSFNNTDCTGVPYCVSTQKTFMCGPGWFDCDWYRPLCIGACNSTGAYCTFPMPLHMCD